MGMRSATAASLRRHQLDRALRRVRAAASLSAPQKGWIREVRSSLGMTTRQLGRRLGVSQSAAVQREKAEEDGTISLSALRRTAAAMDCDVAYFLLPKKSLEATVRARAQALAAQMAGRVDDSLALEGQAVGKQFQTEKAEELTKELIRRLDRGLWNQLDETDLPGFPQGSRRGRARTAASIRSQSLVARR